MRGRVKRRIVVTFPFEDSELSKIYSYLDEVVSTTDEYKRIKFMRLRLVMKLAEKLGLRIGSILKIKLVNLNFKDNVLFIPSEDTKTGYPEFKRLYGDVVDLLLDWINDYKDRIDENGYLFFGSSRFNKNPYVTHSTIYNPFQEVLEVVNLLVVYDERMRKDGVKRRIFSKRLHDLKAHHHIKVKNVMSEKSLSDLKHITGHRYTHSLEKFYLDKGVVSLNLQDQFIERV